MKANHFAVLATALFVTSAACAQDGSAKRGRLMDGLEISATFSGMTMTGNYGNGVKFTESYLPDGSLSYQDDEGSDHGRWFVRGSLFCTFYEASEGACYSVRKSAENCFEYFTQEKEDGSTHENAGAWNSVGWDQFKPTSCDLADKVS